MTLGALNQHAIPNWAVDKQNKNFDTRKRYVHLESE